MLMMTRFFGRDLSDLNQSLHQRMIFRELAERAAFENVGAAVSHPRHRPIRGYDRGAYSGGTHSARLGMFLLMAEDEVIGLFQRRSQKLAEVLRFTAT